MKRSEMIQILYEAINGHMDVVSDYHVSKEAIKYGLERVEEAGMLPPIHEDIPDDDQEYIGYAMGEFHNWEKEDEEK